MTSSRLLKMAALGGLCMHGLLPMASAEDTMKVDWSFAELGSTPTGEFGSQGVPIFIQDVSAGRIVDAMSTPPNPFPDVERALWLGNPEPRQFRLRTRPLMNWSEKAGWFEFEFQIQTGKFVLGLGAIPNAWDPTDDWSYIDKVRLLNITFEPGESLRAGNALLNAPVSALEPGTRYVVRLEWDFATSGGIRMQINGEPVLSADGGEFIATLDAKRFEDEFVGIGIFSGSAEAPNAEMFIGKMTAGTKAP